MRINCTSSLTSSCLRLIGFDLQSSFVSTFAIIRSAFPFLAFTIGALASPALADTKDAWCFTQQVGQLPTTLRQCGFSQRQGNVNVYRGNITYIFSNAQQGISYERVNDYGGIIFRSPNGLVRVFWERPCSEWSGCAGDSWLIFFVIL